MKKQREDKEKYSYCFPDPMAKFMKNVDDRTQMEASLMSMFLLLIGLVLFTGYIILFSDWNWWMRGMTIFNSVCGFIFLFSYLITTFQQYQALRETQEIVGSFGTEDPFPIPPNKESNLKNDKREVRKLKWIQDKKNIQI